MSNLELIEKLILEKKTDIDVHKEILLRDDSKKNFHNKVIKESEESINILNQIKTELEAWEVVQGAVVEGQDHEGYYCFIETIYFTGKKGETVKKGLKNDDTR